MTEGPALAEGAVKWAVGNKGCKTTKIIPDIQAMGSSFGEEKLSDRGTPMGGGRSGGNNYEVAGTRLDSRATSISDSVSIGTEQQKIRELLTQRHLSFREQSPGGAWMIEESNRKCRMWFDEKAILVKKQMVFVTE